MYTQQNKFKSARNSKQETNTENIFDSKIPIFYHEGQGDITV